MDISEHFDPMEKHFLFLITHFIDINNNQNIIMLKNVT